MENKVKIKTRDIWVDNIKVLACILVALGHFFQSMEKSGLMNNSAVYEWFEQTIYTFHVPLFFIASGYLYQKYSAVNSFATWKRNVLKKAIALGIPYFTFSICTWLLKTVFVENVNTPTASLGVVLFTGPSSPYWFLYALFFIFVITPTYKNVKVANIVMIAALIINLIQPYINTNIYAIDIVLKNEIWFMMGICLKANEIETHIYKFKHSLLVGVIAVILFILFSVVVYILNICTKGIGFFMGAFGCVSIVTVTIYIFKCNNQNRLFGFMAKYTMPIFLMHTLFAATWRSILLKLGVNMLSIHIVTGIAISIIGPIIAAIIMKKTVVLEFFLYPNKFIKIGNRKNESING